MTHPQVLFFASDAGVLSCPQSTPHQKPFFCAFLDLRRMFCAVTPDRAAHVALLAQESTVTIITRSCFYMLFFQYHITEEAHL